MYLLSSTNICRYLLQQQGLFSCLVIASKSGKTKITSAGVWGRNQSASCTEITGSAPFCRFCLHPRDPTVLSSGPPGDARRIKITTLEVISVQSLDKNIQSAPRSRQEETGTGEVLHWRSEQGRKGCFQETRRN